MLPLPTNINTYSNIKRFLYINNDVVAVVDRFSADKLHEISFGTLRA